MNLQRVHPAKLAMLGYLSYIFLGWILLAAPFSQSATSKATALDHLFISTSAVSTTGLVTVSVTDSYSFLGELIVLLLIQVGGIGYMTFGSFVILSRKPALPPLRAEVGKTVFSLPDNFKLEPFLRGVILFTLVIETVGAAALYAVFSRSGVPDPVWSSIFHSISAFCTAGFGLYNNSFESMAGDFWVNAIIAGLSYAGAVGFIVCLDFWNWLTGRTVRITLTSKIILWATFWLSLVGTGLIFLSEPLAPPRTPEERLLISFFQAMSAMTTVGFNTIPIGEMSKASVLLLVGLMIIGASPSGTGGGLKSTTFSALLGVVRSAVRGEQEVRFWGKPVPLERVWMAIASLGFYLATLFFGVYLLELTQTSRFEQNLFEAASALGTVGLSMGITGSLTGLGKVILIFLMFAGRLGPLTFGIALFCKRDQDSDRGKEDLAV